MTVFQGIFLSEGTPEGRGPQPQDTPAGHAARSHAARSHARKPRPEATTI